MLGDFVVFPLVLDALDWTHGCPKISAPKDG